MSTVNFDVPSVPVWSWSKVPQVTLSFWVIKILSTTVGETCADYLAVEAGWGQGLTRGVMAVFLMAALYWQLRSRRYSPWIYWLTVVLVSIVGTQITDLLTDGMEVSLYASTTAFSVLLAFIFSSWYRSEGTLSIQQVNTRKREGLYWATVLCTFALGTAAGDLATDASGLGFHTGVLIFGMLIGLTYAGWRMSSRIDTVLAFWACYILTRPFGAALGDLLTQSPVYGGFGLGALRTSTIFLSVIALLVGYAQFTLPPAATTSTGPTPQ